MNGAIGFRITGFRIKGAAFAVICALLFAGCTSGSGLQELLSPPKLTREQDEIYQALIRGKGTAFQLKYPKSGDYRSAFVLLNLDREETEEAVVFYEANGLWLSFLDQTADGGWEAVYDLSVNGIDIERVFFTTLGADAQPYIVLHFSVSSTEKGFAVIKYADLAPERVYEDVCSFISVDDFWGEGPEILSIKTDYATETASANFYSSLDGKIYGNRSAALNPDAREYRKVEKCSLNARTEGLVIDFAKGEDRSQAGTDILVKRGGGLANIILERPENSDLVTRRKSSPTEQLASPRDIDGDGYTELCSSTLFPGYSSLGQTDRVYMTVWRGMSERSELEREYNSYFSDKNGYVFVMPNRWQAEATAKISLDGNRVDFYEAKESVIDAETLLMSIRSVPYGSDAPSDSGWRLYAANPGKSLRYYVRIENPLHKLALTEDEMENGFWILEE